MNKLQTPYDFWKDEIEFCNNNPIYFVETHCHIEDKDTPELIQPFKLWEEQKKALLTIGSNKKSIILKARQVGITWLVLCYAAKILLCNTGRTVIALSRSEKEAMELVRRLVVLFRYMPALIQPEKEKEPGWIGATYSATALKVIVDFGSNKPCSVFDAFASSASSGRSFTADLLLFDEWAFQDFAREIWKSAFPTINRVNGGQVIGLSTIKRGSLFEEHFVDDDNDFAKIFISWKADPSRTEEWYENTKRTMKEDISQEYPSSIEEALKVPGGAFFPEITRETHVIKEFPKLKENQRERNVVNYVCLDYGFDMLSVHWIEVDEEKHGIIYRGLNEPNKTIREACDIILSLSQGEKIKAFLAPPDLWSRSQESGKSRAVLFYEGGISLTKTSNNYEAGCAAMKEQFSTAYGIPTLQFLDGEATTLYDNLTKIQKDKLRPNVYAKQPHDLTHAPDSIRCFCVWWVSAAKVEKEKINKNVPADIREDYRNGNAEVKKIIREKWGRIC